MQCHNWIVHWNHWKDEFIEHMKTKNKAKDVNLVDSSKHILEL